MLRVLRLTVGLCVSRVTQRRSVIYAHLGPMPFQARTRVDAFLVKGSMGRRVGSAMLTVRPVRPVMNALAALPGPSNGHLETSVARSAQPVLSQALVSVQVVRRLS
jgi:hypothetical protein